MGEPAFLSCPDCDHEVPRRESGMRPESWRGVRQRLVKHRRKEHGFPSPETLRAMVAANERVEALGDPLSAKNLARRLGLQGEEEAG